MAKLTIIGNVAVLESDRKFSDIQMLEKYSPKALSLFEVSDAGVKTEVFRVGTTDKVGNISKCGISFDSVSRSGNGAACLTVAVPCDVEDVVQYITDKYGAALMKLNAVEAQFEDALAKVEEDKATLLSHIVIA